MSTLQPGSDRSGRCPCGTGRSYVECCAPYVEDGAPVPTAEALMRSRYTAYALHRDDHVFRTWHPRTRPAEVATDPSLAWTGLTILGTSAGGVGDGAGTVEFRATWEVGGQQGAMHELSRFERRAGRWVYVDGDEK
jgi:SEC-C motif-containing protein